MNNYIYEYYQKISDGSIVAGAWVKLAYEYLIKGLECKSFFYSAKKAKAAITFIENFCHHHEGALAPRLIELELWQKAFLSAVFGILDKDGRRQFREVLLIVARKNGKTLFAAAIAEYMTFLDGEYGAKIYFCAPKLQQANLCFDAYYNSISQEPELSDLVKKRRTDIYVESTNTAAMPLAYSAKKSDGLNIHLGICDEVAAWAGDTGLKFYEVLKSSMGARKQPMLLSTSTAGYESDGVYDELLRRATRVLKGSSRETRFLPVIYMIDDPQKWNDINELQKSNPNLGVSTTVDYLLEEIAVAEDSISKKLEFLTKYCNVKQNSSVALFSAEDVAACFGDPLHMEDFHRCYCVGGLDLSQTTDLTSACICIERNGVINVFAHFWLPENKIDEAAERDNVPYRIYIEQGFLSPSGENYVDYHDCENWFLDLLGNKKIYPVWIGYDRYSAQYLVQEMQPVFQMDDVFQGFNLTPVIREVEGLIKDRRIYCGDNELLKIHLLNAAIKTDAMLDRARLVKIKATERIDGVAALLDAMCVRQKWWTQVSTLLANKDR